MKAFPPTMLKVATRTAIRLVLLATILLVVVLPLAALAHGAVGVHRANVAPGAEG